MITTPNINLNIIEEADPFNAESLNANSQKIDLILNQIMQNRSNPNLLDNGYFADPINQRGQTEYIFNNKHIFTIDRFLFGSDSREELAKCLIEENMIILDATSITSDYLYFTEYLDFKYLKSDIYTFSLLTSEGHLSVVTGTFTNQNIKNEESFSLVFGPSVAQSRTGFAQIKVHAGRSVGLVAAKLELGPTQTLAHQDSEGNWVLNDPPPNKMLELAKCQRYHVVYGYQNETFTNATCIAYGYMISENIARFTMDIPVPLKGSPIVESKGLKILSNKGYRADIININALWPPIQNKIALQAEVSGNNQIISGDIVFLETYGNSSMLILDTKL